MPDYIDFYREYSKLEKRGKALQPAAARQSTDPALRCAEAIHHQTHPNNSFLHLAAPSYPSRSNPLDHLIGIWHGHLW
jgi:hypothetical protein